MPPPPLPPTSPDGGGEQPFSAPVTHVTTGAVIVNKDIYVPIGLYGGRHVGKGDTVSGRMVQHVTRMNNWRATTVDRVTSLAAGEAMATGQRVTVVLSKPDASVRLGIELVGEDARVKSLRDGSISAAPNSGIRAGQTLLAVNGQPVRGHEHGTQLLRATSGRIKLELLQAPQGHGTSASAEPPTAGPDRRPATPQHSSSSHAQPSPSSYQRAPSRAGPRAPVVRTKCTGEVVNVIEKPAKVFGFFRIQASCTRSVTAVLGPEAAATEHYFETRWLPTIGNVKLEVRRGDVVACMLSPMEGESKRFRVRQLQLERCGHLSDALVLEYVSAVLELAERDAEKALLAMSKCVGPWMHVLNRITLDSRVIQRLLCLLHELYVSRALPERKRAVFRSIAGSNFIGPDGSLAMFLQTSPEELDTSHKELVSRAVDEFLVVVPEEARSVLHLITDCLLTDKHSPDATFLVAVVKRLLPASQRVEQLEWDELPLVLTPNELLGSTDPVAVTPCVLQQGAYRSGDEYIDTYFRLARCEGFGQLRSGIRALLAGKLDPRDMNVYTNVTVQGVRFGTGNDAMSIMLTYRALSAKNGATPDIMYGNLLCLSLDGSFEDPIWAVVSHFHVDSKYATALPEPRE
eukprot:1807593-Prymnesium_polylepis.1